MVAAVLVVLAGAAVAAAVVLVELVWAPASSHAWAQQQEQARVCGPVAGFLTARSSRVASPLRWASWWSAPRCRCG